MRATIQAGASYPWLRLYAWGHAGTGIRTTQAIDVTVPVTSGYRVGSDVPASVDCDQAPDHPDCQAA